MVLKSIIKKFIPAMVLDYYSQFKYSKAKSPFKGIPMEEVFARIHKSNYWKNEETVSGPGSTQVHTQKIVSGINDLIQNLDITSILDIPCGDFNWMRLAQLSKIEYTGADIVDDLITKNQVSYGSSNTKFIKLDLTNDTLPTSDLILNRDCLVHFSYEDIHKALMKMISSGSIFLLSTTFPDLRKNYDITSGDWRPINLEINPFNFPKPFLKIEEQVDTKYKSYNKGKILGAWKLLDLQQHLRSHDYKL